MVNNSISRSNRIYRLRWSDDSSPLLIKTVRGAGYVFVADVTRA